MKRILFILFILVSVIGCAEIGTANNEFVITDKWWFGSSNATYAYKYRLRTEGSYDILLHTNSNYKNGTVLELVEKNFK